MHEAQMHDSNLFVTMTYDQDNCPTDFSLVPDHPTRFWKRLRRWHEPNTLRYYMCGEYGDNFERPHYHACIFGVDLPDKEIWTRERDNLLWHSPTLDKIWSHGRCLIGELTFESAAYVARYVTKKITGAQAAEHYTREHPITGAIHELHPEYARMSRRPGIGANWLQTYYNDVYPYDEVIVRGHPTKPPRYYDRTLELEDPGLYQAIKLQRELAASTRSADQTPARLAQRETVKLAQAKLLKRGYEIETHRF